MWNNFESIDESDLQALVDSKAPEGRDLEYKREYPGKADSDKIPFLAQVSAFANTVGGRLLIGMADEQGVANSCCGIDVDNPDQSTLKLEQVIRAGIEPVIVGIRIKHVRLENGKCVIVIEVPRSYAGPHRVNANNHSRFYARNSAGKYEMDVSEIRRSCIDTEEQFNSIKQFRLNRIASVMASETPVPLKEGAKGILHLIPFDGPRASARVDVVEIEKDAAHLKPLGASGWKSKLNFDGAVSYCGPQQTPQRAYTQIYRNGVIEAVQTFAEYSGHKYLPSGVIESELLEGVRKYTKTMRSLGLPSPIYLLYTLVGVKNYELKRSETWPGSSESQGRSDRDVLIFPEIVILDYDVEIEVLLCPLCDMLWNAFGYSGSPHFDKAGHWRNG